jgi:1-deoxy-D-xylulose-5-phosphate reductoisomerase
MVEFVDGSVIAQASPPDMHLPIALGLAWPDRVPGVARACAWETPTSWTFEPVDNETFPALALAKRAATAGGTAPAVLNAANEVAVARFLQGQLPYLGIVDLVSRIVDQHINAGLVSDERLTVEDVVAADLWGSQAATQLLGD